MIKWEKMTLDYDNKKFKLRNGKEIELAGYFELAENVYAKFSDSNEIFLVDKIDDTHFTRIEITWFFDKEFKEVIF